MQPFSDPETLRLLVEQRQAEVRRTAAEGRLLATLLASAARRSARLAALPGRAGRMRPSKRPA